MASFLFRLADFRRLLPSSPPNCERMHALGLQRAYTLMKVRRLSARIKPLFVNGLRLCLSVLTDLDPRKVNWLIKSKRGSWGFPSCCTSWCATRNLFARFNSLEVTKPHRLHAQAHFFHFAPFDTAPTMCRLLSNSPPPPILTEKKTFDHGNFRSRPGESPRIESFRSPSAGMPRPAAH